MAKIGLPFWFYGSSKPNGEASRLFTSFWSSHLGPESATFATKRVRRRGLKGELWRVNAEDGLSMEHPETLDEKNVQAVFQHAARLMAQGQSTLEIEGNLEHQGLNHESAAAVVRKLSELCNKVNPESGQKNILVGALFCFGGIVLTAITFLTTGWSASYVVGLGAIVFGAIQVSRGEDQARDLRNPSAPLTLAAATALSESTSVISAALIQVKMSYPAFSTMQAACEPVIEIDGKASKGSWGTRLFLVSSGRHTIKAYHRWLLFDQAFASEVTVDVPEGAVVCLHWRTGHVVLCPGRWTQLQSGTEVTLVSKEEQSALTRPCPSCGKTIKCVAEVCEHCGQCAF